MSVWVFDASPLIFLGKLGRLEWLPELAPSYRIPQSVVIEILAGPEGDLTKSWITGAEAQSHIVPDDEALSQVLAWDLGEGETAVICHVLKNTGSIAILDDRAARTCAGVFGAPVIGTLGILLRAKHAGLLSTLLPELERLQLAGSLLSNAVMTEALRLAGEQADP